VRNSLWAGRHPVEASAVWGQPRGRLPANYIFLARVLLEDTTGVQGSDAEASISKQQERHITLFVLTNHTYNII
jgi:hypothetical protein